MDAVPPGVVTIIVTAPEVWAGVYAVICEVLITVYEVADMPSKVTALAPAKSDPVMVTKVPPRYEPDIGEMLVMVGTDRV